ncbi:MAG: hypothetical protein J5701_06270 [Bacteroidales bacterium]|nr:hypothetical protein [Bacteroidales bacterium]
MKNIIMLFAVVALLASNVKQETKESDFAQKKGSEYTTIKLNDRFNNTLKKGNWDSIYRYDEATFSPVYLGDVKSEIKLIYKPELTGNRMYDWECAWRWKSPSDSTLLITIDTSRVIGYPMGIWEYYKKPEYRRNIMSYPVFLENISEDTMSVGFGDVLDLMVENKDENGQWQKMLEPFIYDCGTGLGYIYLAPHQIAVTAMPICEGSYRTEMRIVFRVSSDQCIYSNVFEDFWNE